jgi:membrane protease YdiL (CAAX protease family)
LKRFFLSEAGAVMLWVVSSLVLAAALAPWLYQAGKSIADSAAAGDLPGILEWLGAACERAEFGRFFSRSLLLAALVGLPLLLWRVRVLKAADVSKVISSVAVPWQSAVIQIAVGCVIAAGLLWGIGWLLEARGVFTPKPQAPGFGKLMGKILVPTLVVPPLEEWLIRGLLLGIWLRFSKPFAACVGTSLFFAFIHFLKPPAGSVIADPASALAGFELLGKVLFHFANPRFFVTDFATLFFGGMILAWARVRTGALWFSIGLHAGWIAGFKAFNQLYQPAAHHPWGIAETFSGIFPMVTLGLTAVICHFALRRFDVKPAIG